MPAGITIANDDSSDKLHSDAFKAVIKYCKSGEKPGKLRTEAIDPLGHPSLTRDRLSGTAPSDRDSDYAFDSDIDHDFDMDRDYHIRRDNDHPYVPENLRRWINEEIEDTTFRSEESLYGFPAWSPLSRFNRVPQVSRAVKSIGDWQELNWTTCHSIHPISRFSDSSFVSKPYKPCVVAQCCLVQGHKSRHRIWRIMCASPECTLFTGHSSPHSSLQRCDVGGCTLSAGHSCDHIIPKPTMREIYELATDHALAATTAISKLNRKVLGAMSHQNNSRLNETLLGQFVASLGADINAELVSRVTFQYQEQSERLHREAAEALAANTLFALKVESTKKELVDQRAKRRRATSETEKPLVIHRDLADPSRLGLPNPTGHAASNDGKIKGPSVYMDLDFSNLEMRLFELYPSHGSDNIRGAFRCANVSSCPDYTALSYTWGDDTKLRQIYFQNGTELGIRENLWLFLRDQSMLISQPKLFWIDAICINQSNIHERNHQVNLMRQIYARAGHVNIWLGQEDDDSDIAMDFLACRAKQKLKCRGLGYRSPWSRQEGRALMHLCNRPYWRRMWIIQEIIYAKDITIWCGSKSCEWSAAESLYLKMKSLEDENWQTHHEYVVQVLQSSAAVMIWQRAHWRHPDTTAPSLLTLINIFQDWQCTDIRDKVYSLVEMASKDTAVTPDYSLSAHQLYHDVIDKSNGPRSCGVLSQILGIPADDLNIDKPDL
ncbi:hypothetical protein FVEN_g6877 [Fusarium venenatum]|nr:hypothetical protein FVEN_g6877 [Fusarium venenatum]